MTTILRDFEGWPRGPLHLAIGVFDGVHLGHRALVGTIAGYARDDGGSAIATTFDPLPVDVLAPGAPPSTLTDIDERCVLLGTAGAHAVAVFRFTRELSLIEPEEFVRRVASAGDVRSIVVGADFRFGHDRGGDVRLLAALAPRYGYRFEIARQVTLDGAVVSSTRVRNALIAGDVEGAARLLDRRYAVTGLVTPGSAHGRGLGYPTLDLTVPGRRLLPRDGIYALWVTVDGERAAAAGSLGVRSSSAAGEHHLEAYLLDRPGTVGAERVRVEFVKRIRDELRFASPTELAEQIARDVDETRAALRASP